jgi:uncharacterized protein YqeY
MLEQRIEQDLKTALLAGDTQRVSTLRMVRGVLLDVKVATGKRGQALNDSEILPLLSKEAKKRQESADMYIQGGDKNRADAELAEKAIIEAYLPPQLSEDEVATIVDSVINETHATGQAAMGQVIGLAKQRTQGSADGALIARLTKEKLGL